MPEYTVKLPDGGTLKLNGPEGASDQEIIAQAQRLIAQERPGKAYATPQIDRQKIPGGVPDRSGVIAGVDAAVRGAANGYTGGLADRFAAAANTVLPLDEGSQSGWQNGFGEAYRANLAQQQATTNADNTASPAMSSIGNIGGALASPLSRLIPAGAAGSGLAGRLMTNGANDALYGALYSGAQADYGKEDDALTGGAATGAAGGLAGNLLAGATGRVLAPATSAAVRKLRGAGVPMTFGQIMGGPVKSAEDRMTSIPGLGDLINRGRRNSLEGFNRAAVNEALSPIGEALPAGVKVGREAARYGQEATSKAYDQALSSMSIVPDPTFRGDLSKVQASSASLPDAQRQYFDTVMERDVRPFMQGQTIDGKGVQSLKRGLDKRLSTLGKQSASPADELAAEPLEEMRAAIMNTAERQNPQQFSDYMDADGAYARMQRINDAASRMRSDKEFTPNGFAGAVARKGYGTTTAKVARGDALMQELADAASEVLPSQYPDSGSAGRIGLAALLGGGAAGAAFAPKTALAGAALSLPYIPGIDRAVEMAIAGQRPASVRAVGGALRRKARVAGAIGAPLALQQYEGR